MKLIAFAIVGVALLAGMAPAQSVTSAFTYQGELSNAGSVVNGAADLRFRLYDTAVGGTQIGGMQQALGVGISNGKFAAVVDFGAAAISGQRRWLEIDVASPAGSGVYSTLTPRQELTAAPYASFALNVAPTATPFFYSSTNAIFTGADVGAGIATPSAKMHVMGTDAGTGLGLNVDDRLFVKPGATPSSSFVGVGRSTAVSGSEYFGIQAPVTGTNYGGMYIRTDSATGRPFYGYATSGFSMWTYLNGADNSWRINNNGDRVTVLNTGNVGIGTIVPAAPLDVAVGDKRVQFRYDANLVAGINVTGTGGNLGVLRLRNKLEIWGNDAATAAGALDVRAANGTATMSVDGATGNTSVAGTLTVDSSGIGDGTLVGPSMRMGVGSGEGIASRRAGGANQFGLDLFTNFAPQVSITNGGLVGIGTTSPITKLDVNGLMRTAVGVQFPDGSIQYHAAADADSPSVTSGLPVTSTFTVSFSGSSCKLSKPVEFTASVVSAPISGSQPNHFKSLGGVAGLPMYQVSRVRTSDQTWYNRWLAVATTPTTLYSITCVLTTTGGSVTWTFPACVLSGYSISTNAAGQAIELMNLDGNPSSGAWNFTRVVSGSPVTSNIPGGGTPFAVAKSGVVLANTSVIGTPAEIQQWVLDNPSDPLHGTLQPSDKIVTGDISIRCGLAAASTLFPQYRNFVFVGANSESDEFPLTVTVGGSTTLASNHAGFKTYRLRQAEDGLPVEEFDFYYEHISIP